MAGFIDGVLYRDPTFLTTSAGDNNDVTIGGLVIVVVSNNNDAITGFAAPNGWAEILVVNSHATNNLVIKNNSSASVAGNRISVASGADLTIPAFNMCYMGYDTVNAVWHVFKIVG